LKTKALKKGLAKPTNQGPSSLNRTFGKPSEFEPRKNPNRKKNPVKSVRGVTGVYKALTQGGRKVEGKGTIIF